MSPDRPISPYPPIADYAMISDCHCVALVSRSGSIDWCCMPRIDDDSLFGRILDWHKGGYCAISPVDDKFTATRSYLPGTMILETRFRTDDGEARLIDFFAMDEDILRNPRFDLIRIVEGLQGSVELDMRICPRFDYGEIIPRVLRHESGVHLAIGGNKGLIIQSDVALQVEKHRDACAAFSVAAGQRARLVLQFQFPELMDSAMAGGLRDAAQIDQEFERTLAWWQGWSGGVPECLDVDAQTLCSAITLKGLTFERTGAIAAAATTSLPESIGGPRNWDYRFSWVRDSVFTVRALHQLGFEREADRFHGFIERSSAGSADELQIMYGVDGKRRLTEVELDWLDGYRQSRPVRIGNGAAKQAQLDIYGELLEMAWEWHDSGRAISDDYRSFLVQVLNAVCERWQERDHGIWEMRSEPAHFVHSKAMCWAALHRGVMLAEAGILDGPAERWLESRDAIRLAIESRGFDAGRGIFVQAFDSDHLDAALLLLPRVGFVDYQDPRMLATTDAICRELGQQGMLLRYRSPDNLPGNEGVFVPCTFWLVSCLAHQGKLDQAWDYYRRALACANDLGLFSEEFDVEAKEMLGNFPQALTHVSQITARLALARYE